MDKEIMSYLLIFLMFAATFAITFARKMKKGFIRYAVTVLAYLLLLPIVLMLFIVLFA